MGDGIEGESQMGPIENLKGVFGSIPLPETFPETGEPLTKGMVEQEITYQEYRYGPLAQPSRQLFEWNEDIDEMVYVRELTEKEYRAEMVAYRKATKRWVETGGVERIPNAPVITGVFGTESGSVCEGTYCGEDLGWFWRRWILREGA